MRLVRIALANVNTTVGAVVSNRALGVAAAHAAAADGATFLVLPEQLLAGYSPEDLVHWRSFVAAQWKELEIFARETAALQVVCAFGLTVGFEGAVYNAAAVVWRDGTASDQLFGELSGLKRVGRYVTWHRIILR